MVYRLKVINPKEDQRWDDFVLSNPEGCIYHHSAWGNVIESSYRFVPFYVALEQSDTKQLEGIMPFMLIDSNLTGKRLTSLPFTSYCQPLIPKAQLQNAISFVIEHHPDIDYVEIKSLEDTEDILGNLEKRSAHVIHVVPLDEDLEQIFQGFHHTSVRQRIRKAEKMNLKLRMGEGEQDLREFYRLETAVRRKHGLPPAPYTFFQNLWKILKSRNLLILPMVEHEGRLVAAATVLKFKNSFHMEYSASDPRFLNLCPNHKLIWEVIKMAKREGARCFDFGRSSLTNRSLIAFKERWGAKRYSLSYHYFPQARRIETESSLGRKILCFANRYLPNSLLEFEGRLIYRHIG